MVIFRRDFFNAITLLRTAFRFFSENKPKGHDIFMACLFSDGFIHGIACCTVSHTRSEYHGEHRIKKKTRSFIYTITVL